MTSRSPQGESQRQKREPLEGNTRFEKIQVRRAPFAAPGCSFYAWKPWACTLVPRLILTCIAAAVQALNSGSYGFVYLCKDLRTGELVAIKFIERGEKVTKASCTHLAV